MIQGRVGRDCRGFTATKNAHTEVHDEMGLDIDNDARGLPCAVVVHGEGVGLKKLDRGHYEGRIESIHRQVANSAHHCTPEMFPLSLEETLFEMKVLATIPSLLTAKHGPFATICG